MLRKKINVSTEVIIADDSFSASSPQWIELPTDVTENILSRLGPEEMLNTVERVCTTWRNVCGEPSLWRVLHMKYPYKLLDTEEKRNQAGILCRRAVDRSQGELINVNINHFATDDLLQYISQRSTLKILTLENCWNVSINSLIAAVKNFPLLEELHLYCMTSIGAVDIKAIGVACPMLKAFTFYEPEIHLSASILYYCEKPNANTYNNNAFSIAANMPNLVRLSLVGNRLMDEGLLAILDGCRNLEWLDLRGCDNVYLQGNLGKRCFEQLKVLRAVYQWDDNRFYDPEDLHAENNSDYEDDYGLEMQ